MPQVGAINSVVNEEENIFAPHDTVIDELWTVVTMYTEQSENLAIAAYALLQYICGNWQHIEKQLSKNNEGMLKIIYKCAKRMQDRGIDSQE